MKINNDILSIISIYSDIKLKFNKDKLVVTTDKKCQSCDKRMRRTDNSLIETFVMPSLWEMDTQFFNETAKYIKLENTMVLSDGHLYTFQDAIDKKIVYYVYKLRNDPTQLNGIDIIKQNNVKILVKKAPSLYIFYNALKDIINEPHNKYLKKLKEYTIEGYDDNVITQCISRINIIDKPKKMPIRLCSKCRKDVKKGLIFK